MLWRKLSFPLCIKLIFFFLVFLTQAWYWNVRATASTYFDNSYLLGFRFSRRKMARAFWRFPRRFPRIKGITWSERLTRTVRRKLSLGWWWDRWAILGGKKNSCRWRRNWSLQRLRRNLKTEEYRKAFPRNSSASWLENRLRKWVAFFLLNMNFIRTRSYRQLCLSLKYIN